MKLDNGSILKLTGQEVCECASVQSMFWTNGAQDEKTSKWGHFCQSPVCLATLKSMKIASTSTQMCKECVWSDLKKTTSLCWLYLKWGNTVFCFLFEGRTVYRTESECMSSGCNNQSVTRLRQEAPCVQRACVINSPFLCRFAHSRPRWWCCRWKSAFASATWWRRCSSSPPRPSTMPAGSSERGSPRPRPDRVRTVGWTNCQRCRDGKKSWSEV